MRYYSDCMIKLLNINKEMNAALERLGDALHFEVYETDFGYILDKVSNLVLDMMGIPDDTAMGATTAAELEGTFCRDGSLSVLWNMVEGDSSERETYKQLIEIRDSAEIDGFKEIIQLDEAWDRCFVDYQI